MGYLITQIIICLLIAAIIGFVLGWLFRGSRNDNQETYKDEEGKAYERAGSGSSNGSSGINTLSATGDIAGTGAQAREAINQPVTKAPEKSHKIETLEGIGKSIGNFLRNIGVKTTIDLIEKCSTKSGFQQVVKATKVVEPVVKQWVSMADLMRVPDINGQYAELMEASDIISVKDLASADAQALSTKMQTINQREHRIPDSIPLPDVNRIARWVKDAKTLPEKIW